MATVNLEMRQKVNTPSFDAWVEITGGTPGEAVDVEIRQTRGLGPLHSARATGLLDSNGQGTIHFPTFQLGGPVDVAMLVATAVTSTGSLVGIDAEGTAVP